eukprot:g19343.t1
MNVSEGHPYFNESYKNFPPRAGAVAVPEQDGDGDVEEGNRAHEQGQGLEDNIWAGVGSGKAPGTKSKAKAKVAPKAKVQGKAKAKATATAKAKAAGTRPEEVVDEDIFPADADNDSICPEDSASNGGYRRPSPIEEDEMDAPPNPRSKATGKAKNSKTSKATARPKAKATSTPSDHLDSLEEEDRVDVGDEDEDEAPPPKTKGKAKAKAKARAPAPPEGGEDEEEVDDYGDQEPQAQHPLVPPLGHQNFVTQWRKLLMERAGLSPDDAYASPRDLDEQRRRENLMRDAGSFGVDLGLKSYQARIVFGLKERILKRILVNHQAGSGKTKLMIAYLDEAAKMAEKERRATRESLRNTHHRKIVFDKSRQMENFELQLLQNPSDLRAALFDAQTREDTLLRLISSQFCRADQHQQAECTQSCGDDLLGVGDLGARAGRDATFEAVKKRLSDRANKSENSWANAQWKLRNGCKIDAKKEAGADDDAPAASYVQIQKMLRRSSMGVHKTHVYQSARAAMSHASGINWDQLEKSVARPSTKGRRAGDRVTFIVDEAHLFVESPNNKADNAQIAAARKQFLTALREKLLMQQQESVQVALLTATPEKELLAVLLNCRDRDGVTKTGCVRMNGSHAGLTGLVSTYADGGENDTARPLFYSPAAPADERSAPKAKAGDPEAWLRRQGKRSPVSKAAAELDFLSEEGRDLVPGAKSTAKSKAQFIYERERRGGVDGRRLKFSVVQVTVPNETRALYYMKQREGMKPGSLARLLGTSSARRKREQKRGRGSNDGRAFLEPLPGTEYLRNEAVAPKFNVFARHLARRLQEERSNFVKNVRAIGPAANGGSGCTSVERLKEIAENRLRFLVLVDTDAAADALSRVLNVVLKNQLQGAGRTTTAAGAKGKAKAKAKALAARRGSTSNSKPQHLPVYRLKMTKSAQDAALAEGGYTPNRLKGEKRRQALQDIGVLMEAKQFDSMKFGVLLGRAKEVGTGTDFQKLREVHVLDIPRARDLVQYFGRGTRLNAHQDLTLRERDEKCVADWLMTTTGGDEAVVAPASSAGGDAAAAAEGAVAAAFRWQNVEANVRNFLYVSRFSTTMGAEVAGRSRSSAGAPRRRRSARSKNAINPRNHAGAAADAEPDTQGNRQEEELQLGEQLLFQLFLRASLPTNMKITEKDGMEKKTAKGFQEAGMLMQAWGAVGRGWGWAVGVGATKKELASRVVEIARNPRSAVAARDAAKRIITSVARDVDNARTHADISKAFFDAAAGLPTYKAAAKLTAAVKGTIKKALGLDKLREAFNEQAAGNGAAGGKSRKAFFSMLSLKTQDEVLRDQMFERDFVSMGLEERDFYRDPSIEGANLTVQEVTNFEAQLKRQKLAAGGLDGLTLLY